MPPCGPGFQGVQKRIEKVVDVQIQKEMSTIESRLLFLATTGAAAPFIGLFGTVWGIMTSFQAIANSQNTNLAVVAPGIAEALFATAIGLVAAIPATIFYNMFSADAGRIGREHVAKNCRWYGSHKADGRGKQGFRDAGRYNRQIGILRIGDGLERGHDARPFQTIR